MAKLIYQGTMFVTRYGSEFRTVASPHGLRAKAVYGE